MNERPDTPPHEFRGYDCDCTSCDHWRSVRVIRGSLVRGLTFNRLASGFATSIRRPSNHDLRAFFTNKELALVISVDQADHTSERSALILIPNSGVWLASTRRLCPLSQPEESK